MDPVSITAITVRLRGATPTRETEPVASERCGDRLDEPDRAVIGSLGDHPDVPLDHQAPQRAPLWDPESGSEAAGGVRRLGAHRADIRRALELPMGPRMNVYGECGQGR